MRTHIFAVGLVFVSLSVAGARDVKVFIAPRSSLVPHSGKVVIDVYWFNTAETLRAIPNMESYGFSQMIASRTGQTLPRFIGGAHTIDHPSRDRAIPARKMVHDQVVVEVEITSDEFAELTADFSGTRCGTFKSNTIILVKRR